MPHLYSLLFAALAATGLTTPAPSPGTFAYFNAIGAALRTDASIKQPNGLTIFPVTVPSGSIVYHGTDEQKIPRNVEWVAFEPDFALMFAQTRPHLPQESGPIQQQRPFQRLSESSGSLLTFEVRHDLNLLLLDGLSAFKRSTGTQDLQDILLLNNSMPCVPQPGVSMCEQPRAEGLCNLARDRWNSTVDGFVRKDPEWEIIVCSFERSLRLRDTAHVLHSRSPMPLPPRKRPRWSWDSNKLPNTKRDDSVIQSIIRSDFDLSLSVFDYDSNLGSAQLPRLINLTTEVREAVMGDIDTMLRGRKQDGRIKVNWQAKADMLVLRYGPVLQQASVGNLTSVQELREAIEYVYMPFLSTNDETGVEAIRRCSMPYTTFDTPSRAAQVVHAVAEHVCDVLFHARAEPDLGRALKMLRGLKDSARWKAWPLIID